MKRVLLSIMIIGALAAPAFAVNARPVWFQDSSHGWHTMFYLQNIDTSPRIATVTFYNAAGTSVASTSRTLGTNGFWKFSTADVSGLADNTSATASNSPTGEGVAIITGSAASIIVGYTSIANTSTYTGYNPKVIGGVNGLNSTVTQE